MLDVDIDGKGHKRTFWDEANVLHLVLRGSYTDVDSFQNSSEYLRSVHYGIESPHVK